MRAALALACAAAAALALPAATRGEPAPAPARAAPPRSGSAPRRTGSVAAPAPPRYAPRYAPPWRPGSPHLDPGPPRWSWDPYFYGFAPVWWGWGWGYGSYPLDPRPEYGYAPEDVARVSTRLSLHGSGTLRHGGSAVGLVLGIEGERLGFHLGIDGLAPGGQGYGFDASSTFAFVSSHLTFALLATDVARVRGELGASLLTWPDYGPDAAASSLGPDVGVSAQLGLVGPLGVEGYARVTPIPVPIYDWQAALALRAGPVAVTAGWRELSVHRSRNGNNNVSRFAFAGPQVGVGLRF